MEATISVYSHPPKQLTRAQFIDRWTRHAEDLKYLGMDIVAEVQLKANEKFNKVHMHQRIDAIERLATGTHPGPDYRDMIHDELHLDPTRTDDEIAHKVAMAHAFP